jgi:hypothetical protein
VVYALDYSYNVVIENKGDHKYKAVRLTPEIYSRIRTNMADLIIYDKNGEVVPYFINSFAEGQTAQKKEYFTNSISPKFSTKEQGNTTIIKIQGIRNLQPSSITLKTDSIFKRNVTFNGSVSKVLYNLNFTNESYRDLTIPLSLGRITSDTSELIIDNKDDKPIKVSEIEVKYLTDELIFEGSKSNEYTLKFGNNEIQTPKDYDISNYRELILKEGYDVLSVKEIREIKEEPPKMYIKPQYDYKLIFNISISVAAVVMGVTLFLKLKK